MDFAAPRYISGGMEFKRNVKITECLLVAWFTRVHGHPRERTKQPVYTLIAVQRAYVLRVADT